MTFEEIASYKAYELVKAEKSKLLNERLIELTELHRDKCEKYRYILDIAENGVNESGGWIRSYTDLPFLPVRLFKELELRSVPENDVVKTMSSSGTTGQADTEKRRRRSPGRRR